MPEAWRTVRVFISSTFRDMQAERDHLVRFVFPRLREELLKRRIHLVDVDLRWGVTSEQDALDVCREIIDECRPRFLCILGGRYGWVPPGKEHSITADEVRYGVLDRPGVKEYRYFYFRDPGATDSIPGEAAREHGYVEADAANAQKLADLKQAVRKAGFEPFVYDARWDPESQRLVGLEAFGNRVYADLLASVDDEFGTEAPEALDEFAEEDAAMEAFIEERVERYVVGSRQAVFDNLTDCTQAGDGPSIVALAGPSGSGKSALLGKFSQDYARDNPDHLVITHFVGASVGSADLRCTLRRLCHALAQAAGDEREIPQDVKELVKQFPEVLSAAAQRQQVVLILDALNQLDVTDNAHSMYWLPRDLLPNVRVIVSSLEHPTLEALRRRGESVREIALDRLEESDSRLIIQGFLDRYHKRLSESQIEALLTKPEKSNPLYLLVALEELRTLGGYEEITQRIRELPGEAQPLFLWIMRRLEADAGFRDADGRPIGPELVRQFVSCLGVSRHGFSQMELAELIAWGDQPDAQGNVAALIRLLRPYLMHRGELLDFYHAQLREAVEGEYLDEEHERLSAHRQLAEYFRGKADPAGDSTWTGEHLRGLSELPYHQTLCGECQQLDQTLCSLYFMEAKCAAGLTEDLIEDYRRGGSATDDRLLRQKLQELRAFLASEAHVLRRHPELMCQQAANQPGGYPPADLTAEYPSRTMWIEWCNKRNRPPSCLSTFAPVVGRPACASVDAAARRVAVVLGRSVHIVDLEYAGAHTEFAVNGAEVSSCALTPRGDHLFCGHQDGVVSLWDVGDHSLLGRCLLGAEAIVAVDIADQVAVAAAADGVGYGWDCQSPESAFALTTEQSVLYSCALHPSMPWVAFGGPEATVELWDYAKRKRIARIRGTARSHDWLGGTLLKHRDRIVDCTFGGDGRYLALAQFDRSEGAVYLLRFDGNDITCPIMYKPSPLQTSFLNRQVFVEGSITACALAGTDPMPIAADTLGNLLCFETYGPNQFTVGFVSKAHESRCMLCRSSDNGRRLVTVEETGLGKLWDVSRLRSEVVYDLEPHVRTWSGAVSSDGRKLVLCRDDGTLALWDVERRRFSGLLTEGRSLRWYDHARKCAMWMPDDHFVISGGEEDYSFDIWDVEKAVPVGPFATLSGPGVICRRAPDGQVGAFVTADGKVAVIELETRRVLQRWNGKDMALTGCEFAGPSCLVLGWRDGEVAVWDWHTDRIVWRRNAHTRGPVVCTANQVTGLIATAGLDGVVRVWRPGGGQAAREIAVGGPVTLCATSPCGRWLATQCNDLVLYEWATGSPGARFPTSKPTAFMGFASSETMCLAYADGEVAILRVQSGFSG